MGIRGPFARLVSDRPDDNGELHIKVVQNDERVAMLTAALRDRVMDMVGAHILRGEHMHVRSSDARNPEAVATIRFAVNDALTRAQLATEDTEELWRKIIEDGHSKVLVREALWGRYMLDVGNVEIDTTPTRS